MSLISRRAAFAAVLVFAGLAGARAEMAHYTAKLDGASETPATDSKGSGSLDATYDAASKTLTWTITYSGLTGPAIAAHFHGPAPVGKAAGILVPIKGSLDSPIKGSAKLTDAEAKALTTGMMYFNIHTAAHKPGEIRGQLTKAM